MVSKKSMLLNEKWFKLVFSNVVKIMIIFIVKNSINLDLENLHQSYRMQELLEEKKLRQTIAFKRFAFNLCKTKGFCGKWEVKQRKIFSNINFVINFLSSFLFDK